jgi:hypothetical protein
MEQFHHGIDLCRFRPRPGVYEADSSGSGLAAHRLREQLATPMPPVERKQRDLLLADIREHLGDGPYAVAWSEGQLLTPEQALEEAGALCSAL